LAADHAHADHVENEVSAIQERDEKERGATEKEERRGLRTPQKVPETTESLSARVEQASSAKMNRDSSRSSVSRIPTKIAVLRTAATRVNQRCTA
jgi:hypothetical protein